MWVLGASDYFLGVSKIMFFFAKRFEMMIAVDLMAVTRGCITSHTGPALLLGERLTQSFKSPKWRSLINQFGVSER